MTAFVGISVALLKAFVRDKASVFFSLVFPLMFLFLHLYPHRTGLAAVVLLWAVSALVPLAHGGGDYSAGAATPPRRGSPPPWSAPVAGSRSTAWQPPKNRLRSRNQAIVRPLASSSAASIPGSA